MRPKGKQQDIESRLWRRLVADRCIVRASAVVYGIGQMALAGWVQGDSHIELKLSCIYLLTRFASECGIVPSSPMSLWEARPSCWEWLEPSRMSAAKRWVGLRCPSRASGILSQSMLGRLWASMVRFLKKCMALGSTRELLSQGLQGWIVWNTCLETSLSCTAADFKKIALGWANCVEIVRRSLPA